MLKVLFVSSGNSAHGISPFVKEQGEALQKLGIQVDFFLIEGKGIRGYFRNILILRKLLKSKHYDILHGHFIWSILVCLFQRGVVKAGTFHGTDLNKESFRLVADRIVMPNLALKIVVSEKMASLVPNQKTIVIPCGIDFDIFYPITQTELLVNSKVIPGKVNVLFCSDFQRPVKNPTLAFQAIKLLEDKYEINFIEMKSLSRSEVNLLLNMVDFVLMTSFTEGSPQIIKEAMACNCPIVSTDVGDVRDVIGAVKGCYITTFDPSDVAEKMENAIRFHTRTDGRSRIGDFSNQLIAERILSEYNRILTK